MDPEYDKIRDGGIRALSLKSAVRTWEEKEITCEQKMSDSNSFNDGFYLEHEQFLR
jgi:hypothetical protein